MFKLGAACWDNCQTTPLSSLSNPAPSAHYSFCKTVLPLLSIRFRLLCCVCDQGVLTNQQVWIWNLASAALCSMLVDHNCACGGWGSSGHAGVGIADYTMLRRVTQCRHHRLHSVTQCYAVWATSIRCRKDRKCAPASSASSVSSSCFGLSSFPFSVFIILSVCVAMIWLP